MTKICQAYCHYEYETIKKKRTKKSEIFRKISSIPKSDLVIRHLVRCAQLNQD